MRSRPPFDYNWVILPTLPCEGGIEMLLAMSEAVQEVALICGVVGSVLTPIGMAIVAWINNKIRIEAAAAARAASDAAEAKARRDEEALRAKRAADADVAQRSEQVRKTLAAATIANSAALSQVAERVEAVNVKVDTAATATQSVTDRVNAAAERVETAAAVAVAAVKACTEHPELVRRIEKLENGNGKH